MNDEKYFESIRCEDFQAQNLFYHEKRIYKTAKLKVDLKSIIKIPDNSLIKCKIIYNRNEIISISYDKYKQKKINTFKLIYDNNIDYYKKMLNRKCIDDLYQSKGIANEIIIVKNNLITDTSIANIAIFHQNRWITPKKPLLNGTFRQKLINTNQIFEDDITVDMIINCEKLALINAMIGFYKLEKFTIQK